MDRLKRLIQEIHHRSLWQVLGIYVVGSWLAIQVVQTLTESLGMPLWFPQFAVVLLIVGFPIVMATAFVQEGLGTKPEPPGPPQTTSAEHDLVAPSAAGSLFTWRNALFGGMAALALWGVAAAGWMFAGGTDRLASTRGPTTDEDLVRTVAVLPLANLSPNPDHAYFADGVHEEILGTLSKIADLTVLSRQAVMQYRDSPKTMMEIGSELNAGSVVEGSVRRDGNSVRVTVQLIDASTDGHIWSENYDRVLTAGNIFAIQTDIAESIARALRATLTPIEQQRLADQPTENLEAYDYLLGARAAYNQFTVDGFREAIRLSRLALSNDPDYADAWAELANAYSQLHGTFLRMGPEWLDSAEVAADRAISLDPDGAEGYKALALVVGYEGFYARALELNLQALERNPNHAAATHNVGWGYYSLGRIDEAIRWYKKADRLEPSGVITGNFAVPYAQIGEPEIADRIIARFRARFPGNPMVPTRSVDLDFFRGDADAAYREATEGSETFPESATLAALQAQAALAVGRFEEAVDGATRALRLSPEASASAGIFGYDATELLGYALLRTGQTRAGRERLEAALGDRQAARDRGKDDPATVWTMAAIHAALGDTEEALDLVEEAYEAGFQPGRGYPTMDPLLGSIRDHPRFQAVMQQSLADLEEMRRAIEAEEIATGER